MKTCKNILLLNNVFFPPAPKNIYGNVFYIAASASESAKTDRVDDVYDLFIFIPFKFTICFCFCCVIFYTYTMVERVFNILLILCAYTVFSLAFFLNYLFIYFFGTVTKRLVSEIANRRVLRLDSWFRSSVLCPMQAKCPLLATSVAKLYVSIARRPTVNFSQTSLPFVPYYRRRCNILIPCE